MRSLTRTGPSLAIVALSLLSAIMSYAADKPTNPLSVVRVPGALKVLKAQLGADGAIHLLANSESGPRYLKSEDGGLTFSTPMAIVDMTGQRRGLRFDGSDLAVGGDGRVHVAMSNNGWQLKVPKEESGFFYASLAPGAKAFSSLRNLNHKPSEGFSLAAGEGGAVTASFLSGKLYTMVSRDGGETFSSYEELNPAWDPCNCCTTSTTYGQDGRLALLYREKTNDERDMYLALWDQSGGGKLSRTRISSTLWKIAACPMTYFTIVPSRKGYVAAWPTRGHVYFARLDKEGALLSPGEIKTPGMNGMRSELLALGAADGTTLIAWKNNDTLGWQLYDGKGDPQGKTGSAPSPGNGAAGIVLRDGRFVLFP